MRRVFLFLGVVLAIGAGVAVVRMNDAWAGRSRPSPGQEPAPGAPSPRHEDQALTRLRNEIARAEPVQQRSDEERLADALAWVGANRAPDWPYADLEARMLSLYAGLGDEVKRSARWVLDAAAFETDMIRSLDADTDGIVSDDEARAFADFAELYFSPESHPYLLAKFDTDGDGSADLRDLAGMLTDPNVLAGVAARVKADRWDADGDGLLGEGEIATGRETLRLQERIFEDGHIEYVETPAEHASEEQAATLARMTDTLGPEAVEAARALQDRVAPYYLSIPLTEAMHIEERIPAPELDPSLEPAAPDMTQYDLDGDGGIDGSRMDAYTQAWKEYRRALPRVNALREALRKQAQFSRAAAAGDADRDGRMTPQEWGHRLDDLLAERSRRLFLLHYDLDSSGRVDPPELDSFLTWYRAGSLRADANYDGAVDALDLEEVASSYSRQAR